MKTDEEILALIEEKLEDALDDLWCDLTPEDREQAFPRLIMKYVEANWEYKA